MQILAITQARISSTRLPAKVLKRLGSATVLDLHLKRVKKSKLISSFLVATTDEVRSSEIEAIAEKNGFESFRGDENDVLDRFYQAAKITRPDLVVRVTSDCPLIDPTFIDDLITKFIESGADYACNCLSPTLPDGMDAEVFKFSALEDAWKNAKKKSEREHVTPYIRDSGKFKILSVTYAHDWGGLRMTLDTEEDYAVLQGLVENCGEEGSCQEYVSYLVGHPELKAINSVYERNEGYKKSLRED
jgi:spore coat polysaccharide biosynthesis protein SpsF